MSTALDTSGSGIHPRVTLAGLVRGLEPVYEEVRDDRPVRGVGA